jgi:hypothetical protein
LITVIQPAQAEDQKVLAIIDSAINSANFSSIIHEVCFTLDSCPNEKKYMEGPGAASSTGWLMTDNTPAAKKIRMVSAWPASINNATYHGDAMVKAALVTNPNIKIVFIRFHDVTSLGNSRGDAKSLASAIDWVSKNASRYSIDAVSISQSSTSAGNLALCSTDTVTINAVSSLNTNNIPVFVATGNDKSTTVVGFPACVHGAIGVGALWSLTMFEKATNTGLGLDLVALGGVTITKYGRSEPSTISGTSAATVVSASSYVRKNTNQAFTDYINLLEKVTVSGVSYSYASK